MSNRSRETHEELVQKTLDFFYSNETEVYFISDSRSGPQLYIAYDIGSAAIQAVYASERECDRPLETLRLMKSVEDEAKKRDPRWAQKTERREVLAFALNNYSPEGPFKLN